MVLREAKTDPSLGHVPGRMDSQRVCRIQAMVYKNSMLVALGRSLKTIVSLCLFIWGPCLRVVRGCFRAQGWLLAVVRDMWSEEWNPGIL